jgi:hypothetical protein
MAARIYGSGRVVAFGHDGIFNASSYAALENGQLLRNTIAWLDSEGVKQVGYTSGHGEFVGGAQLSALSGAMSGDGYVFAAVPGPITLAALAGNAWAISPRARSRRCGSSYRTAAACASSGSGGRGNLTTQAGRWTTIR